MKKTIIKWILAGCVLFLIVLGMNAYMRSFSEQALAPITESAQALKTQVAQVLHPTPTIIPDPVTIINEVRSLARLETIQYSVEKVITAESGQEALGALFGDRLLFVAHGVVIAGIDLNQMEISDFDLRDGILTVDIPEAEVFIASLDNDKSYVYDRQTGLLTKGEQDLETLARQAAENEIYNAALEDGILEHAAENGEMYLMRLFSTLGYENVLFE